MNVCAVFVTHTGSLKGASMLVAASSFYRLEVNGQFVAFGPARAAGGYVRTDCISLDAFDGGSNEIVLTVCAYQCRSLSTVKSRGFVMAEVCQNGRAIRWTDRHFEAFRSHQRVQKVQRYSSQRHFGEVWDLRAPLEPVKMIRVAPVHQFDRIAPLPHYEDRMAHTVSAAGELQWDENAQIRRHRYSGPISPYWGAFPEEEIQYRPYEWIQHWQQKVQKKNMDLPLTLQAGEYAIVDLGRIEAGFLQWTGGASPDTDVVVAFSEYCEPDHFAFTGMNAQNVIEWVLPEGECRGMSFEPYTLRFAMVAVKEGSLRLDGFGVKTFEAAVPALPSTGDAGLDAICRGALRTYAHNAVDLFMDCPSRERAGWLCDSFFTGRVERFLYGSAPVETAFLQNYRYFRGDEKLPEGTLPMCYPSDVPEDGRFIPQWTMWYVLESCEYLSERCGGNREDFRASIEGLMAFYQRYENADGLLEKLPSWNFVEWSRANQWTQDVNYPTNFLYAQALEAAGRLYERDDWSEKAQAVRRETIRQSFDGVRFYDHAVRGEGGKLTRLDDCSEVAQYYAILFGGFDICAPEYAKLKQLVLAPRRPEDMEPVNAFIGVYLRLETLLQMGQHQRLLSEVKDFFGGMEQETGTLWEYRERERGSKDHGFASYALVLIFRALGLQLSSSGDCLR